MEQKSQTNLNTKGWQIGTATDFLQLTAEDLRIIETALAKIEIQKSHHPGKP